MAASSTPNPPSLGSPPAEAQAQAHTSVIPTSISPQSAVEMSEFSGTGAGVVSDVSIGSRSQTRTAEAASATTSPPSHLSTPSTTSRMGDSSTTGAVQSQVGENTTSASTAVTSSPPTTNTMPSSTLTRPEANRQRLDSVAIGPSIDDIPNPAALLDTSSATGPTLLITLLLSSSGARHPYKIDEKYLMKRNVGTHDPFAISVYTLKELILREWRDEWEGKPSSPSSIRLIFFGRLLDDKNALKECKFSPESANVVHMTVRPQDIVDEEDASKGKTPSRDREGDESTAGCRCVIL